LRAVRDGEYIALQTMMRFSTLRGEGRRRNASEMRKARVFLHRRGAVWAYHFPSQRIFQLAVSSVMTAG
jgi:hypothetical protein